MDDVEARNAALIEFVGTFVTVSESIQEISDLSDGVALFEALSEIAPDYFDPTTIARHLGDNWALKSSNLRKLVRNLENFYHLELKKDADFAAVDMQKMSRHADPDCIAILTELITAAAVTCPEKNTYVQRIMSMSPETQVSMKGIIQQAMSRLSDFQEEDTEGFDETELVFDDDNDDMDQEEDGQLFGNQNDLEQQLEDAKRELAAAKSQAADAAGESETAQKKLQALVEDLQDRLVKRNDELIQVEEDLQKATSELEETKSNLAETAEQKATLEDDLDVAKSKAQQLYKAEATVVAYKKKLEGVGVMNQQMEDLEGQAEKYLAQIMELESEVKKSTALQKTVTALEAQVAKLEKELADSLSSTKNASTEVDDLKGRLTAAEKTKKLYEDELTELRDKQGAVADSVDSPVASNRSAGAPSSEQVMRLEIENKQLRQQLAAANGDGAAISAIAVPAATDSPETTALKLEIQRMHTAFAAKEKENAKISSDKDKLEAYTKRTLAKFQDKYLVALQECKAKLKEKQDKIELLEKRSASERSAQKREERLLSSTIFELGLGIMQNRLKGTSA